MDTEYAPAIDDEEDEDKKDSPDVPDPVAAEMNGGTSRPRLPAAQPGMVAPPDAPDISGGPASPAPGDMSIAPAQAQPAPPPRPTPGMFAPKPQTRMGRLFNGLAVGAAAMNPHNPGAGMEVAHELNVAPQERAQQAYEAASGAYDTEKAQGLAERKEITEEDKEKNVAKNAERVPVTTADGRTAYIPEKDLAKFLGTQETNTTKKDTTQATNDSKENIAGDNNRTKQDISDNVNQNKQDIATETTESKERIAQRADKTKRELGMARIALGKTQHLEKAPPEIAKAHETLEKSVSRYNVMQENAEEAKKGNQQAMLSLVANHIGMTMGLVPGARVNKQTYTEAIESAPWLARMGAKFDSDGYLSGVTLTPKQIDQMVDLSVGRLAEDRRSLADTEEYYGWHGQGGGAQHAGGGQHNPPPARHDTAAGNIAAPKTADDYMANLKKKMQKKE